MMGRAKAAWDLDPSVRFQAYGGALAEAPAAERAVAATEGEIITFGGAPVIAYYHADSGGHTEEPAAVWGTAYPYLPARADSYSIGAEGSAWEFFLSAETARRMFGGEVFALTPRDRSPSGRVRDILVETGAGRRLITGNDFRLRVGGRRVRSTLFTVNKTPSGFAFRGKGYGHGVGMSQQGARAMAAQGFGYREILAHYYRGIDLEKIVFSRE